MIIFLLNVYLVILFLLVKLEMSVAFECGGDLLSVPVVRRLGSRTYQFELGFAWWPSKCG